MQTSDIPAKFAEAFAASATATYKRVIPQTSGDPNAASLHLGFPPNTFVPVAAGGAGPDGRDFNGILNETTAMVRWLSAGAPLLYDATFQANIGGYPKGAVVAKAANNGTYWLSTADNNVTDPDTGGAGWVTLGPAGPAGGDLNGTFPNPGVNPNAGRLTGEVIQWMVSTAPAGWLICDGSAVSRATYAALWTLSAGGTAPFGVGDGSTTFNLPDLRGRFLRGWDDSAGIDPARVFGSVQADAVQTHNHGNGVSATTGSGRPFTYGDSDAGQPGLSSQTVHTDTNTPQRQGYTSAGTVAPGAGNGTAKGTFDTETRPTNVAVNFIIKT